MSLLHGQLYLWFKYVEYTLSDLILYQAYKTIDIPAGVSNPTYDSLDMTDLDFEFTRLMVINVYNVIYS